MKRKHIIFGLIFSICLSGSTWFNPVSTYADDDDYNYNNNYSNDKSYEEKLNEYNYWVNYWKARQEEQQKNQLENQEENSQTNQPSQTSQPPQTNQPSQDDDDEDDYDNEPEKPKVDMTNVTLEKDELEGMIFTPGESGFYDLSFKIKINSKVVLNPTENEVDDYDYDYEDYLDENADIRVESSNKDMYFDAYIRNNVLILTTSSEGKTTLKLTINDKVFKIKVTTVRVGFKEQSNILVKGKSENILTAGSKKYNIKLKSSKPGIVSVSKNGKVKALKEGNAVITGEINGKKMYALVSSISPVRKKAIDWAMSYSNKSEYSQPKRMQNGYYDCSSLVWRAYNKFGVNLGGMSYAPTAAELCRTYDKKKRTISDEKAYKKDNIFSLLPGDLMFFSGEKNGRYKNIYHVEMISSLNFLGVDEDGKPEVSFGYIRVSPSGSMTYARVQVK